MKVRDEAFAAVRGLQLISVLIMTRCNYMRVRASLEARRARDRESAVRAQTSWQVSPHFQMHDLEDVWPALDLGFRLYLGSFL